MSYGSDLARLKNIARKYSLTLTNVKPCASQYKRVAAYRAQTERGPFLIKPFYGRMKNTRLTSKEQIVKVAACVRILQESAYPHMPRWLLSSTGSYWVAREGRPYYMTEWIEGRKLQPEAQDYRNLGHALASLHAFRNPGLSAKSRFTEALVHAFQSRHRSFRRRLRLVQQDKREGYWFRRHGEVCVALAERSSALLDQPAVAKILSEENLHPALIHGDITMPNILIHSDALYLIDWDLSGPGSTYYEVARTLANVTHFNSAWIQALLEGYEEVRPLQPEERIVIRALFGFPREAWTAALALRSGRATFRVVKETWDARLEAIRWMDRWSAVDL